MEFSDKTTNEDLFEVYSDSSASSLKSFEKHMDTHPFNGKRIGKSFFALNMKEISE